MHFEHLHEQTELINVISHMQKSIQFTANSHPDRMYICQLSLTHQICVKCLWGPTDPENSIWNLQKGAYFSNHRHTNRVIYLSDIGHIQQVHFNNLGELSDINDCISNLKSAVQHTVNRNPQKLMYLSYIMQMMRTTNCVCNSSSHGKKARIWIFKRHSPLNGWEIVLCRFRYNILKIQTFVPLTN